MKPNALLYIVRELRGAMVCAAMIGAASSTAAQIYVGVGTGDSGAVLLSNHASTETPTLLINAEASSSESEPLTISSDRSAAQRSASANLLAHPPSSLVEPIRIAARNASVSEALIKAVIAVESGFRANARSPKGAMGLMQLMPQTAQRFGVRDAYAVEENLRGGAAYLRWLLETFRGDLQLAVAAYNAGENAVMRAGWRVPEIAETRAYVPKVLAQLAHFEAQAQAQTR